MSKRGPIREKPRGELLAEMRKRFVERGNPRLVIFLILALSVLAAFGFSVAALRIGLEQMWLRYLLASGVGYGAFLLLIRLWIAFHRGGWRLDGDIPDLSGVSSGSGNGSFGGGGSGGGGASGNWDPSAAIDVADLPDLDDAWPVAIVIAVALSGIVLLLILLFYVMNVAPVLLAEVALDAALIGSVYRRLRKQDARYWLSSAVRHTWKPAVLVAICMSAAGAVAQAAVPAARTIGDVFRAGP